MPCPEIFYIEGSDTFFEGNWRPRRDYKLIAAAALQADDLVGMNLDFSAVALRMGVDGWDRRNNGMLTYILPLASPIIIKRQGPVPEQVIHRLNYAFAFQEAERGQAVGGMSHTPIFRGVSVSNHLSQDGNPQFSFEISLTKSGGSSTNAIVETAARIISDPAVAGGLIAAVPALGIACAVFEVIRTTFLGTGEARVIWDPTKVQFRGVPGIGIPLKVGRYVFLSTRLRSDEVQDFYCYRGGRLVDVRNGRKEAKDVDQFYLDIYAS